MNEVIKKMIGEANALIEKHEAFKSKGLGLNVQDLFDWTSLWEDMWSMVVLYKSTYMENKNQLEIEKWTRKIELKFEVDDNGKKLYTESTADAVINEEFQQRDAEQLMLKTCYEWLLNKMENIEKYINIVKMHMKILNPIMNINDPWQI